MAATKRKPKETSIEKHFCDEFAIEFPEAEIRKFEARMHDMDRILFLPGGVTILVELKRPKATLRAGQERAATRFRDLGFEVYWAATKAAADELIMLLVKKYRK